MPAAAPETPGEMERSSFGGLMELLAGGLGGSPGGDSVTPSEQMRYESPTKDGDSPTSERMRLGSFQASEDLDGSGHGGSLDVGLRGSFELPSPGGAPGSEDAWRGARELGDDLEADAEADEAPRVNYAMMATALSPRRRAASPRGPKAEPAARWSAGSRRGARARAVARRRRPAALLAAKARPFDDESEVDDSDGGESEGQGFALPDWPAYRRKTVSEAPRREDPSVAADALRRENIRRRWRLAKNRIMQKECIDPLAPPLALYEPATLDKFDRAGGPPEALTGGLCGRPASLPPAPVDGALPPREPREAIGELPKYILNRPDADAPANRPPATRRTLVYTYADGAVAAPPEDAPEPGGATAAYVFESRFESGNLLHAAVVERDYGGAEPSPSGEPYPDAEFDCAMCPDVGTGGHTQWFYFRVDGLRKGVRYRFNVTNFAKADSLYLEGMQPLVYGVGAAKSGVGWRRAGKVVCYSKNTAEAHRQQVADMRRASGLAIDGGDDGEESSGSGSASDGESDGGGDGAAPDGDGAKPESKPPSLPSSDNDNNGTDTPREPTPREQRKKKEAEKPNAWRKEEKRRQRGRRGTHTLSFDLTLDDDEPSLYLAYSHPYTYTDLQAFLATLAADPARSATYTRRSLCDTVAGNRCDLLTITAPPAASAPAEAPPPRGAGDDRRRADGDREGESRQRRLVVLSSRVHPGESNASWVMQGILDFLTSDDARAVALRGTVFKICPMLNPDGVIQGNYRCSNSGMDLNRQWSAPSREAHPPVAALKHLIRMYQARANRVALFCDLHGHSRAKGVFLYGILSDADRYGLRARRSLAKDARAIDDRQAAEPPRGGRPGPPAVDVDEPARAQARRQGRRGAAASARGRRSATRASSSEAPAPPKSAPEALGASLVLSPGASRRGVVQIGDRPPDRPPDYARTRSAPTPTPTPISSPLRSSLLRHRPSEAPAARLPVDLDAVSDRVSASWSGPTATAAATTSSAASRRRPYLLDVDDRVLAEEIRDQPAPRVSFNMSRPGSRASLNFPVVPAAANAPPAEARAALPERRPEPPPDSRPSSNDADHRKHRTLSDEKSAS
ncbi:cytosolic carboxypeptidase protein [Aureococcus anophagefferens]|uniref:Cytosolic carboxypeptidase protein n=1 Tax=Aureococcus anophagefferens TaxID=44056 RepID=A0ABR1FYZ0_AURAN